MVFLALLIMKDKIQIRINSQAAAQAGLFTEHIVFEIEVSLNNS